MASHPFEQLVQHALQRHSLSEASDGELLGRFVASRDASAFAELVERNAALVAGTCRRVLGSTHPANDDAFQTTFVTLALKATAVRPREHLPAWLHGVARRVAWRYRSAKPTSALVDTELAASRDPSPPDQALNKEWLAAVDREIDRLPSKYRSAILLCWFDDTSLDQAARQLGTTKGTLWGWLKRAREKLRRRLTARGFGLPAVFSASLLGTAPVSAHLITRTAETGVRTVLDGGVAAVISTGTSLAAAKAVGGITLAATILIGVVTLLPARAPEPARDSSKNPNDAPKVEKVMGAAADGFPFPPGVVHRFGTRQFRHPDGIVGSAMSPDGKSLATLGHHSLIIWDTQTQAAKRVIRDPRIMNRGMDQAGAYVAFLPDGRSIAVAANTQELEEERKGAPPVQELAIVFDLETGKEKYAVKGTADDVLSIWVAAGGKELGTFSKGIIRFFDIKDGKEIRSLPLKGGIDRQPWNAANADRIAIQTQTDNDFSVEVFDTQSGKGVYSVPNVRLVQAAISNDGKRLATHGTGGKVRIHDIEAKKELLVFDHPAQAQMAPMRFSSDAQTLYFGGQHGQLFRWDLKNNKRLTDSGRHSTWTLLSMALSPDETILYSMGWNRLINRWDLKTGKQIPTADGYTTQTAIALTPDGKYVIVGDHGGSLDYWDLKTGQRTTRLDGAERGFDCLDITADGRWLAGGRTTQDVQIWDLTTGKLERTIALVDKPDARGSDHVKRVAFSPDESVLLTSSNKTGITAWDHATGKKLWNASGIGHAAVWHRKGRWIAVAGGYSTQRGRWTILNPENGAVLRQFEVALDGPVKDGDLVYDPLAMDIAVTPEGSRVITAHIGRTVRIWDAINGKELLRLNGTGVAGMALSPDGKWLAIRGMNYEIQLWEIMTGARLRTLAGLDSEARDIVFTRDGKGLIANADLAPTLWDLMPKQSVATGSPEVAWDLLASDDAEKAFQAQSFLVRDPKAAVLLLAEHIKPAETFIERAHFDKLVRDLDSEQFRTREFAEKELKKAGHKVPVAWLRQTHEATKSTEQAKRLSQVLDLRAKPSPEEWRLSRAIQVLELTGTSGAADLLQQWANAPTGSLLAIEAAAAVERLSKSRK